MNTHHELLDDDDDPMALSESRPLLVWFLMAVALVAMAFLLGAAPDARAALPDSGGAPLAQVSVTAPSLDFGG